MPVPVNNLAVSSFYSKEEQEELIKINQQHLEEIKKAQSGGDQQDAIKATEKADRLLKELYERVKKRYIEAFRGNMDAILADVSAILQVINKKHFQDEIGTIKYFTPEEEEAVAKYENCYNFLLLYLDAQIEALQYYELPLSGLEELVAAKCSEWYPNPETDIIPKISTSKLSDILYPIDKVNAELWNCFSIGENTPLKAESDKDSRKGKKASIYVMLDFNELDGVKISRPLTSFDKRVFVAISNLRESEYETMTIKQIYEAMGGTSTPDKSTRNKIIESIETMSRAVVTINTTEENKIYPRLDKIVWESQLLHIEKIKCYSRGQITDYAIRILETPKLYLFARQRNQITSVPLKLFESPISKTEANLLLEDYIFSRIARMRNSTKISRTMLFETIYQKCSITTKKQRQRLPEKIERYLNHYVSVGWIKTYKLTDKSIEIVTYSV